MVWQAGPRYGIIVSNYGVFRLFYGGCHGTQATLVDDEPLILKGLKFALEQDGYETESAYDGEEAVQKFESGVFDLILLD